MAGEFNFTIDPCGDVVLTLDNPNTPFAVLPEDPVREQPRLEPKESESLTYLLSSRHLSLASPVFKAMLSGVWAEGKKDESDGLFHLQAQEWDSEALATVLNIVHGRWSLVPETTTLQKLASIATIVDYYDIRESMQLISSLWMKEFARSLVPNSWCRETILWILVSWVFRHAEIFEQATKVAILRTTREVEIPSDVPIPPTVTGMCQ